MLYLAAATPYFKGPLCGTKSSLSVQKGEVKEGERQVPYTASKWVTRQANSSGNNPKKEGVDIVFLLLVRWCSRPQHAYLRIDPIHTPFRGLLVERTCV